MYFIYHIKGIKIGVSTNPKQRVKNQGYTEYEILEEHTCIDTASNRELELQAEYGYRVDRVLYKSSYKRTKPQTLTLEQQQYIHSHYFKANNQFTKIPIGKYSVNQLANKFSVNPKVVSDCIKRNISRM